jgi:parvulin-like peptidyl-prolyl isomerase
MFETLRRMIFPIIIIVLVFFVAMIVLQWGLDITGRGSKSAGGGTYAANINGENVPLEFYNQIYNNLYQSESQKSQEELTDDQVTQIRQQAWNDLLQDRLLSQEAAKHNIIVTDQDVFSYLASAPPAYIQSMEYFQTDGKFDYQKYMQAMADPQAASFWSQLEPSLRNDLTKMKMQQLVIEAATVGEQDVRQAMLDQYETVKVGVVTVPASPFMSSMATPSDADLTAYYEQHKSDYEQRERASLDIVTVSKNPSELDWESARAKAKEIYDSLVSGEDFAVMAQRYSDDPGSGQQGGDLGWFAPGAMVQQFDSVAFSAKEGDLTKPFRTQFGWHIIKHLGYRTDEEVPEGKTSKEKVRKAHVAHILIKTHQSQETRDLNYQKLAAFAETAKEKDFQTSAKEHNLISQTTPLFFKGFAIQTLGNSPAAQEFSFSREVGTISGVLEAPTLYFVARVAQRVPAGVPPMTEVKGRVANDLMQQLARKIARDSAAVIAQEIKSGARPEMAAGRHKATYEVSLSFTRNGSIGGLAGRNPTVIGTAFSLTSPGQISDAVEFENGAVVLILIERQTPNLDQLNQKRDSVKQQVLYAKQSDLYSKWFDRLVKDSKIENFVEQMERAETQPQ